MNSNNNSSYVNCLSLIHPDDTFEQPITPLSNISFDGQFEFRNSDYISSAGDETNNLYSEKRTLDDLIFLEEDKNLYTSTPKSFTEPIEIIDKNFLEVIKPEFENKIGDGKMEYIRDKSDREMFVNAWQAITITNNWDFMAQQIESFAFSSDPRIYDITKKMEQLGYNGHSGTTFGATMRSMQYLVIYGEEEFKKLF